MMLFKQQQNGKYGQAEQDVTPSDPQAFMGSLKQEPNNIEQQRQQYQDINYKIANVTPARFRLPPCCEAITDLVHLGIVVEVWIISYENIILQNRFPIEYISLYVVCLFMVLAKFCCSSPKMFLKNAKSREEIQIYHESVQKNAPKISYHVQAYHWVTSRTKNRTSRRKVVTYKHEESLKYLSHTDQTENLSVLLKNSTCVRLESNFSWYKGSKLTENNWDNLVKALRMTAQRMDKYHEGWDTSSVQGIIRQQLAFSKGGIPCYLDYPVMAFFYFFGLSIFYDTFFYSVTGQCSFNIQKTISCDNFNGPQLEQYLQNQNVNFQPNNQGVPIMMQQQNMANPMNIMMQQNNNMMYNQNPMMYNQNQMNNQNIMMMQNPNMINQQQYPNQNNPYLQQDQNNQYSNNQMIPQGAPVNQY